MGTNIGFLALVLAFAVPLGGCVESGDESLVILRNEVPSSGCTISTSGSEFRSRGAIDVQAERGYLFTPTVTNLAQGDQDGPSRLAFVEGADIDLTFPSGGGPSDPALTSFSQSFSGSISPNGGESTFVFEIVPKATLDSLALAVGDRVDVEAVVQLVGTLDGSNIRSNKFHYPIEICNQCLTIDRGACDALPLDYVGEGGGECQPLQDGVVECCTSAENQLVCPAMGPTSSGAQ